MMKSKPFYPGIFLILLLSTLCLPGLVQSEESAPPAPQQEASSRSDMEAFKAQFQAQLDQLKSGYENRIQKLETRITTLESDNAALKKNAGHHEAAPVESAEIASMKKRITELEETQPNTAEAVEKAEHAEEMAKAAKVFAQINRSDATEDRQLYRSESEPLFDWKKIYDIPRPFEFTGYLRSGYGVDGKGGQMVAFMAPGAGAKYRLGNEAETYGELGLIHNWLRQDDPLAAPYVKLEVMMAFKTTQNGTYDSLTNSQAGNDIALRQAYVEAGNVIKSIPEIQIWGGQRYYRRYDININDFYYLDMSGYGAGIEDVPVGTFGKMALAWFGGSADQFQTQYGKASKESFDLRLYDVDVPFGKAMFWIDYAMTNGGGEILDVSNLNGSPISLQDTQGFAAGMIHRHEFNKDSYNQFSVQYGNSAAYNFATTMDTGSPNVKDTWRFRVTDHVTLEPSKWLSMQTAFVYEYTHYAGETNPENQWISLGTRPVIHITDIFSIALETGVDYVNSGPQNADGYLWKITLCPQLSKGRLFFSRPVLRTFVTYAKWANGLKGKVGGTPYLGDTEGLSYGLQVEAWW
ncbi:MAG: carbohydrate porin [Verrucomicrobiota bacterium]